MLTTPKAAKKPATGVSETPSKYPMNAPEKPSKKKAPNIENMKFTQRTILRDLLSKPNAFKTGGGSSRRPCAHSARIRF